MFLRALAIFAALAVPLLMAMKAITGLHPQMGVIGPVVAIVATLPIVLAAREARTQALFGAALAAMAASATPELPELLRMTGSEDAMPTHDLREGPLSASAEGYVSVQGFLRDAYVVDEYATGGKRPDQDTPPDAVLLPLIDSPAPPPPELGLGDPSGAEVIELDLSAGRVIVARVAPERVQPALVTLRGKLGPVAPELVESLFVMPGAGGGARANIPAVMLDTLDVPTRAQALTRTALAIGAALLGLALLLLAVADARAAAGTQAPPASDES